MGIGGANRFSAHSPNSMPKPQMGIYLYQWQLFSQTLSISGGWGIFWTSLLIYWILWSEMNGIVRDQALEHLLDCFDPDRVGGVRLIWNIGVDIVVHNADAGHGIGVALDQDAGGNGVPGRIGCSMQLISGYDIVTQLRRRIVGAADEDAKGIVDQRIVRDGGVADVAADAIIRLMRRAVAVCDAGNEAAIEIVVGDECDAAVRRIGGLWLEQVLFFGKIAGGIASDRKAIAGAINKTIHGPVGHHGAYGSAARVAVRGIVRDRYIHTLAAGIVETPEKNGRVVIVPGVVMPQRGAEKIMIDGPAGNAHPGQGEGKPLKITIADGEIGKVLRRGAGDEQPIASCAYRVGRILQIEVPNSQTAAGLSGGREIKKDQLPVGRGPDDARAVLAIDREGLGSPGVEGENVVVGIGRITEIGAAGEIQVGLLIVSCLQGLV